MKDILQSGLVSLSPRVHLTFPVEGSTGEDLRGRVGLVNDKRNS